ncbi:bifunctional metallophosphatase/5'-nucleotidase [Rhizobacter sp. AJA081-3]|nr:bifunctional metallophosphatase/5'-nucleotidase [Rhizobacter sp. AJA081-3]QTN26055.1 bifunctional metallophosphatase/5'-nucleotidase [Rhizobacter sp. AJA081-3]
MAPRPADTVAVKVLAINDFHGNLRPPAGGFRMRDPQDPEKSIDIAAGGAEHLASAVRELRARNPNHVFVAAGDLVGASPLLSALFDDEPTVESLGLMGLAISAVGNHEFDRGAAELLRLQRGGCHPDKGCKGPTPFAGARFQYLAASTIDTRTGQPILPAYVVKRFEGIPVAFIGLTLKTTPQIVMPAGVAGLEFRDEAATVNALVPELRRQGIEAIVVLIHEGGFPASGHGDCPGLSGPIVPIVRQLDPAVDLVISGHTHRAYVCRIDGRLVTSADRYGTLLGEIDLLLDRASGDVREANARNVVVRTDLFAKDEAQTRLIEAYERLSAPLARRVVGRLAAPLARDEGPAGESPLGQLVADAQLAATADAGAQLALMNPGGLRAALTGDAQGTVRYEDLFAAQPFSNALVTITLTGAQLLQVLEQQWAGQARPRLLQVSRGLSYAWDAARPVGQRIVPGSLQLDGHTIAPEQRLRVTVNAYLASGGDNFKALAENGSDAHTGMMDIEALEQYFRRAGTVSPTTDGRIQRLN